MPTERPVVPRDVTLFSFLEAAQRVQTRITYGLHTIGLSPVEYDTLARLRAGAWCCVRDLNLKMLQQLMSKGLIRRIDNAVTGTRVARITPPGLNYCGKVIFKWK